MRVYSSAEMRVEEARAVVRRPLMRDKEGTTTATKNFA